MKISNLFKKLFFKRSKYIPYSRQKVTWIDILAVVKVLKSDFLTQGKLIEKFEKNLTEISNAEYAVGVNSATSALHISCLALGLSEKDYLWTFNPSTNKMIKKNIEYVPGLLKIFDEILVNAGDNTKEDKLCDSIKVEINKEDNLISVLNNGKGIDIVEHKDHKMLVPELIFGDLLTSTNYDDNEKRVTGGRNGYGAKLANIYSTDFEVEIVDKARSK